MVSSNVWWYLPPPDIITFWTKYASDFESSSLCVIHASLSFTLASYGSQYRAFKCGEMWSKFLGPVMSLVAALRQAFRGAVEVLGRPDKVEQPYSILAMTNAWTAILRSDVSRNGFSFLRQLSWYQAFLAIKLMWLCIFRLLSNMNPSDLAESTKVWVQLSAVNQCGPFLYFILN